MHYALTLINPHPKKKKNPEMKGMWNIPKKKKNSFLTVKNKINPLDSLLIDSFCANLALIK